MSSTPPSPAERVAALSPERRAELSQLAALGDKESRVAVLEAACEELGLDSSGTKKQKQARLKEALETVSPRALQDSFEEATLGVPSGASPASSGSEQGPRQGSRRSSASPAASASEEPGPSPVTTPARSSPAVLQKRGDSGHSPLAEQPLTLLKPSRGPGANDMRDKGCYLSAKLGNGEEWKKTCKLTFAAATQTLCFSLDGAGAKGSPGLTGGSVEIALANVWQYSLVGDSSDTYAKEVALELRSGCQPEALPSLNLPSCSQWCVKDLSPVAGKEVEALLAASFSVNEGFFDNDYKIIEKLGSGTFGIVYKARELLPRLNRYRKAPLQEGSADVAAKVSKANPKAEADLAKEAQLLMKLASCEYIIDLVHLYNRDAGFERRPTMLMRFAEGNNLINFLTEVRQPAPLADGRLMSLEEIRAVIRRTLLGLEYMHKRDIMHRDLKPDNILLLRHNMPGSSVLGDLGGGKNIVAGAANTVDGGTPAYLAPERANAQQGCHDNYCKPSDIWPVGVVLFTVLAEFMPFSVHKDSENETAEEAEARRQTMLRNVRAGPATLMAAAEKWHRNTFMRPNSEDPRELMSQLMRMQPDERPSASKALEHAWFSQGKEVDTKKF